jgi:hypothetical protein
MADRKEDDAAQSPPRKWGARDGTAICSWLPASEANMLIRRASQEQMSVSALVRHLLRPHTKPPA